eukprot:comp23129_c3_seq1/m.37299 comp23129_c3_seq1/g.37299  ORF comp23129_c3_seq1/g.37299 comp23129_c3_seq1/m.37299 type:complete len:146 (-) comp23129_c3_seq1:53-490(-)
MPIYSVYVINKAGSLIYHQAFGNAPKLPTNETIFLASMFHGLYAITAKVAPTKRSGGIEVLEGDTFKLHCLQTQTGTKFLVITDPKQNNLDAILRGLYILYADYALKNPFYSMENPIRCELFDLNIADFIDRIESSPFGAVPQLY